MYKKYAWDIDDTASAIRVKDVFLNACETQHLRLVMQDILCRLAIEEERNSELLKEGLIVCIRGNDIQKVQAFDEITEDIRKDALIEAIRLNRRAMVDHLIKTLPTIYAKSFTISIEESSAEIVTIIATSFAHSTKKLLDGLSLAIELEKVNTVKSLLSLIGKRSTEKTEFLLDIFKSGTKISIFFNIYYRSFSI